MGPFGSCKPQAALEVLRTMKDSGFKTNYDVGIVNWTKYGCNALSMATLACY